MIFVTIFVASQIIFGSIIASECDCGLEYVKSRIFYGVDYEENKYPWLAYTERQDEDDEEAGVFCGASLIGSKTLITAAHCVHDGQKVVDPSAIGVYLKSHDLNALPTPGKVKRIFLDEDYDATRTDDSGHDIAIIELEESIVDEQIMPICVLASESEPYENDELTIVGWGLTEDGYPDYPKEAIVKKIPLEECRDRVLKSSLGDAADLVDQEAREAMVPSTDICAKNYETGAEACEGDSGGPLMWKSSNGRWYVLAVSSRGQSCDDKTSPPGFYTKVTDFLKRPDYRDKLDLTDICFRSY